MRTIPRPRVAPFGIRRLIARLQLPVDVSPLSASFFGSWPLRHPPTPLPAWPSHPIVHLHTALGRPRGPIRLPAERQEPCVHGFVSWSAHNRRVGLLTHITSLACDR